MTRRRMLLEHLADCESTTPAVIGTDGVITFGNATTGRIAPLEAVANPASRIALQFRDPVRLILAVMQLDGRASAIALISPDTSAGDRARLLRDSNTTVIASDLDGDELPRDVSVIRWINPIATSWASGNEAMPRPTAETSWIFATSGTTGAPKAVSHPLGSLTRTTKKSRSAGSLHRWGLLFDPCRFAGAQVMLQALMSGSTLLVPPSEDSLNNRLAFLAKHNCTALSCTPTMWRRILMFPEATSIDFRQITLGGEIADRGILVALQSAFPKARIVHIYASAEAGVGFPVRDGLPGFPVSYLQNPPGGVQLKIVNARLHVQNSEVSPIYVGTQDTFASNDGYIDTGDVVELRNDRVYFLGRANGLINVGGNKVYPEEVENVLLSHREVKFARVSPKPNPIMGNLLTAEIVPASSAHKDSEHLTRELKALCNAELPDWKRPITYRIVTELPQNSGGKLQRTRL